MGKAGNKDGQQGTYVSADALAGIFGFSDARSIRYLTKDGVIEISETTERGRKVKRYDLIPTVRRYVAYLREKASERAPEEITEQTADADLRYRKAKAEIMELRAEELKGQMHRSEDVLAVTNALVETIRAEILALPGALAVDLAAADTPARAAGIVRDGINALLNRMTEYEYDPKQYEALVMKREKWMDEREQEPGEAEPAG